MKINELDALFWPDLLCSQEGLKLSAEAVETCGKAKAASLPKLERMQPSGDYCESYV
jgi:hypothetical protein